LENQNPINNGGKINTNKKNLKKKTSVLINTDIIENNEITDKKEKIPNWKKNSDQLRNCMKKVTDPDTEVKIEDDRTPCPVCNRKFAEAS